MVVAGRHVASPPSIVVGDRVVVDMTKRSRATANSRLVTTARRPAAAAPPSAQLLLRSPTRPPARTPTI
eukprot:3384010-Prymnesium_polylepis.1